MQTTFPHPPPAPLQLCAAWGIFEVKTLRIMDVVPLAASFCGFVVFTNLSLTYNTVGFYQVGPSLDRLSRVHPRPLFSCSPLPPQLAKTMTTPCIMILQTMVYGQTFSTAIKLSLVSPDKALSGSRPMFIPSLSHSLRVQTPVIVGVLLASNADVTANSTGTFFAVCGVLVTSLYQIVSWVEGAGGGVSSPCASPSPLIPSSSGCKRSRRHSSAARSSFCTIRRPSRQPCSACWCRLPSRPLARMVFLAASGSLSHWFALGKRGDLLF